MISAIAVRSAIGFLSAVVIGGAWHDAHGQEYPNRSVRIVVPFAAGGGSDRMGRLIGQKLTEGLKQPAVVDFRPGAAGRVGTEHVAKSAPDGYTLLLGVTSALIIAPALYPKLPYDVQKDLAPVALLASNAYVLVVHPVVPATSVRQLITLAKGIPGQLNYASSGAGGPAHLAGELFQILGGIKIVHVPYKGSAPATTAVMGGETDLLFANIKPAAPAVQSGRLRALAITSAKRSSLLPDVPSASEAGLGEFNVETVYGIMSPAGTPQQIVARLNSVLVRGFDSPDTKKRLHADGSEVLTSSAEEFDRVIRAETARWRKVIQQAGIKPQ